jgi:hypothetical protein
MTKFNSEQEIFNFVYIRLLEQGKPSMDTEGTCVYREPSRGLACAAGHLISNKNYNPELEYNTVSNGRVWRAIGLPDEYQSFVFELQDAHDAAALTHRYHGKSWLKVWLANMNKLAKAEGLSMANAKLAWKFYQKELVA